MLSSQSAPLSLRRFPFPGSLALLLGIVGLIILAWISTPFLFWAYNVEQAGRQMETGIAWPDPRNVDALPGEADPEAVDVALNYLAEASRWRPDDAHAYRLRGQLLAAREEWIDAATAYESARQRAPAHPLIAWENALVYERMAEAIERAPSEPLVDLIASGEVEAPPPTFETPFCGAEWGNCYMGVTPFALPFSTLPEAGPVTEETLFLHPPARISQRLTVPEGLTGITFLLGLSPEAREWGTDGATFQLHVSDREGTSELLYEGTIDAESATLGWVPGWADLSPWAGEEVQVTLVTLPGPAGDASADWFGWGDLKLTTLDAARYHELAPISRMVEAWEAAGFNATQFRARAGEAERQRNSEDAQRWLERALLFEQALPQ